MHVHAHLREGEMGSSQHTSPQHVSAFRQELGAMTSAETRAGVNSGFNGY